MKLIEKVVHFLIPHRNNNHKAKLLHPLSLNVITLLLVSYQILLIVLPRMGTDILGYAANISPDEVVRLTNERRIQAGLAPLSINPTLSAAAQAKGVDMINRDYWAHVAPDGTQPWKFFLDFGYRYRYAGENLARDFSNPSSAVDAWMNSPTHRDNLLSPNYKEIGIGVVEGDMAGVDTTVIVQFFGTQYTDTVAQPLAQATSTQTPSPTPVVTPSPVPSPFPAAVVSPLPTESPTAFVAASPLKTQVLVSPFTTTKGISVAIVAVLLGILVIDGVLVSRRRIARIGGRTFAHIAFLGMILAIVLIIKAGQII